MAEEHLPKNKIAADNWPGIPEYVSHKTVKAFKIDSIHKVELGANLGLPQDIASEVRFVSVTNSWMALHPELEVGGYFVIYENGHTSFSPALAFIGGYTKKQAVVDETKTLTDLVNRLCSVVESYTRARANKDPFEMVAFESLSENLTHRLSTYNPSWQRTAQAMQGFVDALAKQLKALPPIGSPALPEEEEEEPFDAWAYAKDQVKLRDPNVELHDSLIDRIISFSRGELSGSRHSRRMSSQQLNTALIDNPRSVRGLNHEDKSRLEYVLAKYADSISARTTRPCNLKDLVRVRMRVMTTLDHIDGQVVALVVRSAAASPLLSQVLTPADGVYRHLERGGVDILTRVVDELITRAYATNPTALTKAA